MYTIGWNIMGEIRENLINCGCNTYDFSSYILVYISYTLLNQIQYNISLSNEIFDLDETMLIELDEIILWKILKKIYIIIVLEII